MPSESPESKFRRDTLAAVGNHAESVNMRLDRTEATVARLADAVEAQSENLATLSANVERLERGISAMVEEGKSQRETVNNLIKLCTALVGQRAS